MDTGRPIPRWLAINWWMLLIATVVESELFSIFHHSHHPSPAETDSWFLALWFILQALWLKRADKRSHALEWYMACGSFAVISAIISWGFKIHHPEFSSVVSGAASFGSFIAGFIGIFVFRSNMERYFNDVDDVGLRLSGWMTFFFSVYYFQYHFHDIAAFKARQAKITP
jgi:hypothetical protein